MSMQSLQLLPALQELPADNDIRPARQIIEELARTGPALQAAEFTSSASFALWGIWDDINVDDTLVRAYNSQYPGLAADHSLYEHWLLMDELGPASAQGFVNGLKGKVAELNLVDDLQERGFQIPFMPDANQPNWDIPSIGPDGEAVLWQVKSGGAEYAASVLDAMRDNPGVHYAVSSEIFQQVVDRGSELTGRLTDIGSTVDLEGTVTEGLDILNRNLGIDVPDSLGDVLPYAAAILAGSILVYGAIRTECQFRDVDRTTRNKIHVIRALTAMSKMGVSSVLATVGGTGGAAVGSAVPIVGNIAGGISGSLIGAGVGMYLNRHLEPHVLALALDITGLTEDDLFYFKNKSHIDEVALSFRRTARSLTASTFGV